MRRKAAAAAAAVLLAGACAGPSRSPSTSGAAPTANSPRSAPPAVSSPWPALTSSIAFSHVVVIVMENKEYGSVIGNPAAPYVNSLGARYALATNAYAVAHPSLPNYLALLGGSTFGISSDCTGCSVAAPNLASQMQAAGIGWRAYMEGLPSPCFLGASSAGGYAKKHDPFVYFHDIAQDPRLCANVVPLARLSADLASGSLPQFAWITPSLCHDSHDCGVGEGDRFLAGLVPSLLRALGPSGALFLTWDEGVTGASCCGVGGGGHVATIVAGPLVRPGARSATSFTHYSILRTIEASWGLPLLGMAGCSCTIPMTGLFELAG